jgi:hypothetical protein
MAQPFSLLIGSGVGRYHEVLADSAKANNSATDSSRVRYH